MNCEEYIRVERVDEHSNVCTGVTVDYMRSVRTPAVNLQRLNEKLVKVKFLIKNRIQSLLQVMSQNMQETFEDALGIASSAIEANSTAETEQLEDA